MTGIFYGVGVGPGDPELMTLKAVRLIRENQVIALPGKEAKKTEAYRIAVQAVPELSEKELISLDMPMTHDRDKIERCHEAAADTVMRYLKKGQSVLFLTLGDPSVYSTFTYVEEKIAARGYRTEMVSGVPSFCAAAGRADVPLAVGHEKIHVLPAMHCTDLKLSEPGTYVLMKSGKKMAELRSALKESGRDVTMVENCGMPQEKIYRSAEEIPDEAGYFSLIIAREKDRK